MAENGTNAATSPEEEMAAIAGVPGRIVAAWADHDADAFSKVFVEDGTMILPGVYQKGRDDIRGFMADGFAGPYQGTQVTGEPLDIHFLSDESAVLITQGGVLNAGETEVSDKEAIRASWVVVKRDGVWSLATYQNSPK